MMIYIHMFTDCFYLLCKKGLLNWTKWMMFARKCYSVCSPLLDTLTIGKGFQFHINLRSCLRWNKNLHNKTLNFNPILLKTGAECKKRQWRDISLRQNNHSLHSPTTIRTIEEKFRFNRFKSFETNFDN